MSKSIFPILATFSENGLLDYVHGQAAKLMDPEPLFAREKFLHPPNEVDCTTGPGHSVCQVPF